MEKIYQITHEHPDEPMTSRRTDFGVGLTEQIAQELFMKGKDAKKTKIVSVKELKIEGYDVFARTQYTASCSKCEEQREVGEDTIDTAVIESTPKAPSPLFDLSVIRQEAEEGKLLDGLTEEELVSKMNMILETYRQSVKKGYRIGLGDMKIIDLAYKIKAEKSS